MSLVKAYFTIVAVPGEVFVLVIFKWRCPLTIVAQKYASEHEAGCGMFLPGWLAKNNKTIFTAIFLMGLSDIAYRALGNLSRNLRNKKPKR